MPNQNAFNLEWLQVIKDLALIICPIIGSVVAILGLRTWNRQLKGSAEYELCRRLLRSIYKYRNAIQGVRNPAIWANEMPVPEDNNNRLTMEQIQYYGVSGAYQKRWDKVSESRSDILTELIEVEVLWGKGFDPLFQALYAYERELQSFLRCYLTIIDPNSSPEIRKEYEKINKETRDILYSRSDESKDEFAKDFNRAIEAIENAIRPMLGAHRKSLSTAPKKK